MRLDLGDLYCVVLYGQPTLLICPPQALKQTRQKVFILFNSSDLVPHWLTDEAWKKLRIGYHSSLTFSLFCL